MRSHRKREGLYTDIQQHFLMENALRPWSQRSVVPIKSNFQLSLLCVSFTIHLFIVGCPYKVIKFTKLLGYLSARNYTFYNRHFHYFVEQLQLDMVCYMGSFCFPQVSMKFIAGVHIPSSYEASVYPLDLSYCQDSNQSPKFVY